MLNLEDKYVFDVKYAKLYDKELQKVLKKQEIYICSDITTTNDSKTYMGFSNFPLENKIFLSDHFVKYN